MRSRSLVAIGVVVAVLIAILVGWLVFASGGDAPGGSSLDVSSSAAIFGAGMDEPPELPGSSLPPSVPVEDADRVRITDVGGEIDAGDSRFPPTGADGYTREELIERARGTDVESYGGISGIVHDERSFFLVGVFLTDEPASPPAPSRLDFTGNDSFEQLSPAAGQVFFVGDGRTDDGTVQEFEVPDGATHLYLGFADAAFFEGTPGTYDDNTGSLSVTVDAGPGDATDGGQSNPLPGFTWIVGIAGVVLAVYGLARWRTAGRRR